MALAPFPPAAAPAHDPQAAEKAFLASVAEVEHAVDSWLSAADCTRPQAVPLPVRVAAQGAARLPILDVAGEAELVRRYLAAGWASASIKDGVLRLSPTVSPEG